MRLYSGLVESENPKVVIDRWSDGGILRNGALVFSMDRNPIIGCKPCRENLQLLKIRSGAVFLVKPNENVIRRNGKTLNLIERRVFLSPTKKMPTNTLLNQHPPPTSKFSSNWFLALILLRFQSNRLIFK